MVEDLILRRVKEKVGDGRRSDRIKDKVGEGGRGWERVEDAMESD